MIQSRLALCAVLAVPALGSAASAHPHMFVDAGVEVIVNEADTVEAIRVTWFYDELFSLSLLQDLGLDPDMDGVLTPEEVAQLSGFDMHWDEGYPGDTYALLGDKPLGLGGPEDWTAGFADGKIFSTHLRRLEAPVRATDVPFVVQSYDPSYYVSYRIVDSKVTGGEGCTAQVFEPDLARADAILESALAEYYGSDLEGEFPAIGAAYSDELRLTCPAGS
jgi:polyphosphate kinase